MDADALDREDELVRGERLRLDLPETRPVERVGEVGAERVEVEVVGAAADLLVDRERDARGRPRCVVLQQPMGGRDDDRDSGLVVGAEQGRAVARDEVVTDLFRETGHVVRVEDLGRVSFQLDRLARPGAVHDGPDARSGRGRCSVDVGDQSHDRRLRDGARHRREDVAVLRQLRVGEADRVQLVDEEPREVELLLRGRICRRCRVGLRVDRDVAEEPLEHLLAELLREGARVAGVSRVPQTAAGPRPSSRAPRGARARGCSRSASGAGPWAA